MFWEEDSKNPAGILPLPSLWPLGKFKEPLFLIYE